MKKIIFIAILALFISPILANASWWNPFTWGKKSTPIVQQVEVQSSEEDVYVPEPVVIQEEVTDKVVEKIVEKPIIKTQTITVQDPALQIKIDALVAENNALKAQIAKLVKANISLASSPKEVEQPKDNASCAKAKEDVLEYNMLKDNAFAKYEMDKKALDADAWARTNGLYSKLDNDYSSVTTAINIKISTAQAEVQLYCK